MNSLVPYSKSEMISQNKAFHTVFFLLGEMSYF